MRKRAIFGGTFDPVHWGHLLIAETALNQLALEQVIWVPAPCPVHKQAAMFEHRLEMVQRAIADHPAFAISLEVPNRSRPSYAIQTLINLQAIYPNTSWYWIVGLDAFQTLPRWYRRQELAAECEWLVAPRLVAAANRGSRGEFNSNTQTEIQLIGERVAQQLAEENVFIHWQILDLPLIGVSSSLIRQYCRDRYSLRYFVPEPVRIYIATHNLYSD